MNPPFGFQDLMAEVADMLILTYGERAYDDERQWAYARLYRAQKELKKNIKDGYRVLRKGTPLFSQTRRALKALEKNVLADIDKEYSLEQLRLTTDLLMKRYPHKYVDINSLEELLE